MSPLYIFQRDGWVAKDTLSNPLLTTLGTFAFSPALNIWYECQLVNAGFGHGWRHVSLEAVPKHIRLMAHLLSQ